MKAVLLIALIAFVAFVCAQQGPSCTFSYSTCTQCEADALHLNCSYCSSANSLCAATSTISFLCSSGTVNPTTCDDCVDADPAAICDYPSGHTVNKAYGATCSSINSPAVTNGSSATGADSCASAVEADSAACQTAFLSFSCSFFCGDCIAATFNQPTYRPCPNRCADLVSSCTTNTISACNATGIELVCNSDTDNCGDIDAKPIGPTSGSNSAGTTGAGNTGNNSGASTTAAMSGAATSGSGSAGTTGSSAASSLFVKEFVALVSFVCGAAVLLL